MTETDQKLEDAVLKRMLDTPPTPHKVSAEPKSRRANSSKKENKKG